MDERKFQYRVNALLHARPDLLFHHCGRSDMCAGQPGLPDLLVVGIRRVIWRELKTDSRLTQSQRDFGSALGDAGQSWSVWRPEDLESGRIERELDELCQG